MKLPASIILISTLLFGCTDTKLPETDTIKWINTAHALLIKVNGGEYGLYSGFDNNIANEFKAKLSLKSSWGINDRYDADEMIKWLINSGHRQNFIDEMNALKKANVLNISRTQAINFLKLTKQDKASIYMSLVDVYKKHGEGAIDAWDYCRALNLLSTAYLAGYYTKEEALDKSLPIAKIIQSRFNSWGEMSESYLLGYNYWSEENPADINSSAYQRKMVYEEMLSSENNPYKIGWSTKLQKTW